VEITRPAGSAYQSWPGPGPGPLPGHFCMVGDLQQSIYGSRADIRNFQRHMKEFVQGNGGERLVFSVTFRTPARVADFLNQTLPGSFGPGRAHNLGPPVAEGATPQSLQVEFVPLVAGAPGEGAIAAIDFELPDVRSTERRAAAEARRLAEVLKAEGYARFGASHWGEICILAPRNAWLAVARRQFEAVGLKVSVQMRRSRSGDSPPYAWLCGLLSVVCEPTDLFEWTGVLRELFVVSDAEIAEAFRSGKTIHWDDPERHAERIRRAVETLRPFILRADEEGDSLEGFARSLVEACQLRQKARALDPSGELEVELDGILARATDLGIEGGSVRQWRRSMLQGIEGTRASGHASADAITLATSHSSKGLEWPVVIPLGLWRAISAPSGSGLRLLNETGGHSRVYFDSSSLPAETKEARERERVRELVRLLYVTLTRTQRVLVIPRNTAAGKLPPTSFQALWGASLTALPAVETLRFTRPPAPEAEGAAPDLPLPASVGRPAPPLPKRLLPHQLSEHTDVIRSARHESGLDEPFVSSRRNEDPIEYGLWWHETMEFLPWEGSEEAVTAYGERRLAEAAKTGLAGRGGVEWVRFRAGSAWAQLREGRWTRLAELSVFSPLGEAGWIDGVIDLVLHDSRANEVVIVDWKTNARRVGEADQALMDRLVAEYLPQLGAYARCAAGLFPGATVRVYLLATELGVWTEVAPSESG
jgi:ATP-dependent exoDNAse (exonuclease V) beta subunit